YRHPYAAATAVLSGRASATPKNRDGIMEAIRTLRVVRRSAAKARTQIRTPIVTAPDQVRERLRTLHTAELIRHLARSRPGPSPSDPTCVARTAMRRTARRYQHLTEEIAEADTELELLVAQAAPILVALPGVGTETAAQLLITAGDNLDRLKSKASFAHLCAAASVPASSGRTHRYRLNRGGDRRANHALHIIALVRMRYDTRTKKYVARRAPWRMLTTTTSPLSDNSAAYRLSASRTKLVIRLARLPGIDFGRPAGSSSQLVVFPKLVSAASSASPSGPAEMTTA
ncbi:transposase, partial [Streptomyces sp. NPDC002688]|uniref:transposase n=1 Tax=Streptomyces sp. NPDC002688 TaxID=3154423 RepID=UPI00332BD058